MLEGRRREGRVRGWLHLSAVGEGADAEHAVLCLQRDVDAGGHVVGDEGGHANACGRAARVGLGGGTDGRH